jgi:arylamine N-acetyltransferase
LREHHRDLRGIPSLEAFLEGIERFHFGGTCYANNYYLYELMRSLGYQAKLCGADMSNPDLHVVSMVTVGEREYLIDVGYGSPFWTPIPRNLGRDYSIGLGSERYVLKPQDRLRRSRMEFYQDGIRRHGYLAKPEPRNIHEFEGAIGDSFRDDATFMNALLVTRFSRERSLVVRNLTVTEYEGSNAEVRTLVSHTEVAQLITNRFDIPAAVVDAVVDDLGTLRATWS